jgi:hypothetical protein
MNTTHEEERVANRERAHKQFRTQPENTVRLVFEREPEPDRGFSLEAYEDIDDMFLGFLLARSERWFNEHPGHGMRKLSVSITINYE